MKLYYFSGYVPNFGDELNTWLWPKLLPEVAIENDRDDDDLFLGIGSILSNKVPANPRKYVLGSGYGGYSPKPEIDDRWTFSFVRGPRTAETLGLEPSLAITDAAILIRAVEGILAPAEKRFPVSFMPHWESAQFGAWKDVAKLADVHLIDPRGTVEEVLADLKATDLLVTEAMHGAIVADALRVPWIPLLPTGPVHRFKWTDWCESLSIDYQPQNVGASTVREFVKAKNLERLYPGGLIKAVTGRHGGGFDRFVRPGAAKRLKEIARTKPTLSSDAQCAMRTEQAIEKMEALRSDFLMRQTAGVPA